MLVLFVDLDPLDKQSIYTRDVHVRGRGIKVSQQSRLQPSARHPSPPALPNQVEPWKRIIAFGIRIKEFEQFAVELHFGTMQRRQVEIQS